MEFEQGRIEDHTDMIRVGQSSETIRARALQMRAEGMGNRAIARKFNADGVPTPAKLRGRANAGEEWFPHTVKQFTQAAAWNAYMRNYRGRTSGPAKSRARRR